jgi:hypothetical protein
VAIAESDDVAPSLAAAAAIAFDAFGVTTCFLMQTLQNNSPVVRSFLKTDPGRSDPSHPEHRRRLLVGLRLISGVDSDDDRLFNMPMFAASGFATFSTFKNPWCTLQSPLGFPVAFPFCSQDRQTSAEQPSNLQTFALLWLQHSPAEHDEHLVHSHGRSQATHLATIAACVLHAAQW